MPAAVAAEAIGNARPPPGRFEVIAERPWVVIDYAHTPDALKRTLQTARTLCTGALWVVFGAGGNRDRAKRGPMGEAASLADRVVLTADNPRDEDPEAIAASIRSGIRSSLDVEVILDRREAIASSVRRAAPDDVIVIAGRGHETDQIIGPEHVALSDADVARAAVAARSPSVIETFFRLEVRDMARARAFYAEAFGATLVFEYPGWSSLRIAGVRVGLVLSVEHAPCRTGLHFTVGDLATARAAVDRAGGRAPAAPIEVAPGVVMADVTDTEGKTFALMLS